MSNLDTCKQSSLLEFFFSQSFFNDWVETSSTIFSKLCWLQKQCFWLRKLKSLFPKNAATSKISGSGNYWVNLSPSVCCTICVWPSNIKKLRPTLEIFTLLGKLANLEICKRSPSLELFIIRMFFNYLDQTFSTVFFKIMCFQKRPARKLNKSFRHNLSFVLYKYGVQM